MRSSRLRKSRRATNRWLQAGRRTLTFRLSRLPAKNSDERERSFDGKLIHAHGKPASLPLPSDAGSTKAEKIFRRASPASVDLGAVHGGHHHVCLRFYPDYDLGFFVPMGHFANRLASSRSIVPSLCTDVRDAALACRSAKCPGLQRPVSVGFHWIRSLAGPPSGSAFTRIHPLPKYFPLSLRSILHRDGNCLAMDLQPGDWHQSAIRRIRY